MKTRIPACTYSFGDSLVASGGPSVVTGNGPVDLVYGFGSMWVACQSDATIRRHGPDGTIQATINLGAVPHSANGVCVTADSVWCADGAGYLVRIDPATNTVSANISIGAGSNPLHCAFDGNLVWTANRGASSLSKIDPATNSVVGTVAISQPSYRLCCDGLRMWAGSWNMGMVYAIDLATGLIQSVSVNTTPWGMCTDGCFVWVSSYYDAKVLAINPWGTSPVVVYAAVLEAGAGPHSLLPVGQEVWVVNSSTGNIQAIDKFTCQVTKKFAIGAGSDPAGLAFDGESVWATGALSNKLYRFPVKERW